MINPLGDKVQYLRKPSGVFIMDGQEIGHTIQCPHHGGHFLSVRGSGTRRAWCTRCNQMTCGHPSCDYCIPTEDRLTIVENPLIVLSKNFKFKEEYSSIIGRGLTLLI